MIGSETERIDDVRFRQASRFAIRGGLIAEERTKGQLSTQRGIQIALSLHRPLRNLIQVSADPSYLQGDLPLMELVMTCLTQRQQVCQRIFSTIFPIRDMMDFQATVQFPTLLALIAIPHQAGDAQIFVQTRRILVLTAFQFRVI